MLVDFLADCDWRSKVDRIVPALNKDDVVGPLAEANFGGGVNRISFIYVCRDIDSALKQRSRYVKTSGELTFDVMLTYQELISMNNSERLVVMFENLELQFTSVEIRAFPDDFRKGDFMKEMKMLFRAAQRHLPT